MQNHRTKLLDYAGQTDALLTSDNPFAILAAVHGLTRKTRKDMAARLATKLRVVKLLYQKGWERQSIVNFFHVIDWMMTLPDDLTQSFRQQLAAYEEELTMRYVSSVERLAREEGRVEGLLEGKLEGKQEGLLEGKFEGKAELLALQLNAKFPDVPPASYQVRLQVASEDDLQRYSIQVLAAQTLDEVFAPRH